MQYLTVHAFPHFAALVLLLMHVISNVTALPRRRTSWLVLAAFWLVLLSPKGAQAQDAPQPWAGVTVGVHAYTWHTRPHAEGGPLGGYENVNPGLYLRLPSGLSGGVYRNSYRRTTAWLGWTWETDRQRPVGVGLTVGGATGYEACGVCPLVVPSLRLGSERAALRVSYLPKPPQYGGSAGVHFSLETRF